jgi:hypothetical protein
MECHFALWSHALPAAAATAPSNKIIQELNILTLKVDKNSKYPRLFFILGCDSDSCCVCVLYYHLFGDDHFQELCRVIFNKKMPEGVQLRLADGRTVHEISRP